MISTGPSADGPVMTMPRKLPLGSKGGPLSVPSARRKRRSRRRRRRSPVTNSAAIGSEAVADAPHRLDGPTAEGDVDLASQVAHVDLDDVGVAVVGRIPDVLDDLVLARHLAGPAH